MYSDQKNKQTKKATSAKRIVSQGRCAPTAGSLVPTTGCTQSMLGIHSFITFPPSRSTNSSKAACLIPKCEQLCQGCMTCHLKWYRISPHMHEPHSRIYALVSFLHDRNRYKEIVPPQKKHLANGRQWTVSHCCTSKCQSHPHHQKDQTNHSKQSNMCKFTICIINSS